MIDVKASKHENGISELNTRITGLENENAKVIYNKTYLRRVKNTYDWVKWLFMLMGIIFGIIIHKFM